KKSITKEISIPETPGGKTTIEFPVMEDAPIDQPAAGGGGGEGGTTVVVSDGSGQRTVAIIVGGAGILALLAAGGVQLLALNQDSKAEDYRAQVADPKTNPNDKP